MKETIKPKTKQRIELIEGRTVREALHAMYFIDMLSFRKIAAKWGVQMSSVNRWFRSFGFEPRRGGEAVKTQWINNPERRKSTSDMLKKTRESMPNPNIGIPRPDAAKRMREFNPMFNEDIKRRAHANALKTFNDTPQRQSQFHAPLTKYEKPVFDWLCNKGIYCIGNELINKKFVDIYLPERRIAVECVASGRFPLSMERHKAITSQGVDVIYIHNKYIKKADFTLLYDYITRTNFFCGLPPLQGEEAVVFGRRNGRIFDEDITHLSTKVIDMNGCYVTFITATANDFIVKINTINSEIAAIG